MSEVTINIPEGKQAKWVNNVLTLVDEQKEVTERIKTFEDACNELGEKHPFVIQYKEIYDNFLEEGGDGVKDIVVYLKLRVIVSALNEGWEPNFEKGEYRYFPWFQLCTKKDYDNLENEQKKHVICFAKNKTNKNSDILYIYLGYITLKSNTHVNAHLLFKSKELVEYACKQFFKEWVAYLLGNPNTSNKS